MAQLIPAARLAEKANIPFPGASAEYLQARKALLAHRDRKAIAGRPGRKEFPARKG